MSNFKRVNADSIANTETVTNSNKTLASTAIIDTSKASIYLKKFCRHFSHKRPVEFDECRGKVAFAYGNCYLVATVEQLILNLESESVELMVKMEDVVARHMERFAFRDEIRVHWKRQSDR